MTSPRHIEALRFPVEALLTLPASKSHANRALICACLAEGVTNVLCIRPSDDILLMVENLSRMGFEIKWEDKRKGILKVSGGLPVSTPTPSPSPTGGGEAGKTEVVLDCKNAGTVFRFLLSVAALIPGHWIFKRDESLRRRPIDDLLAALQTLGAEILVTEDIHVIGGKLQGSMVTVNAGISSQFLSSLLLIAPLLPRGLHLEAEGKISSSSYLDLTEKVMKDFGILIKKKVNTFIVQNTAYQSPASYEIEGDWSAAGAWLVLNKLTGSRIAFSNLNAHSLQPDRLLPAAIERLGKRGNVTIDCSGIPDQVMNLAILAAFRKGTTTFTNISGLTHKESDRIAVLCTELPKAGIDVRRVSGGVSVKPSPSMPHKKMVILDPAGDHRMAMAFSILALLQGSISISDSGCVSKSYPDFFTDLASVASSSRPIVIVGMRGAGKTALAKKLAKKLSLACLDSDKLFESQHGSIASYVSANGWPAFRREEEKIIAEGLKSGTVFSLGGGAVESQRTRKLLKERADVVWLQVAKKDLLHHLSYRKRLPLTTLSHEEEIHALLLKRSPQYREIATIMLPPALRYSEQVPFALRQLRNLAARKS